MELQKRKTKFDKEIDEELKRISDEHEEIKIKQLDTRLELQLKEAAEVAKKKQLEEEEKYQPKMRLLPEEERERLLIELKQKWETVNKQYQGITHIVTLDTMGKVRRKEQYENELQQIEKSIEKLSKKHVFVHD